jgi:hypothetical protein
MAGALGIGATGLTGYNFLIARNLTGAVNSSSTLTSVVVLADVTGSANGNYSYLSTQAASFTLPTISHFVAAGGTLGAGSTVTTQFGFNAGVGLTQATNNYGFVGDIANAANRWNFYAEGTAPNYMAGALGIGTTALAGHNIRVQKPLTGDSNSSSITNESEVQSDVTTSAYSFYSRVSTQAAAFTLPDLLHYTAAGGAIGAGSTVTNQYGFNAGYRLTQATNNFGFYGAIASAANCWNFYAAGTAPNYMAGALGIGATSLAGSNLRVSRNLTGATSSTSIYNDCGVLSDVTVAAFGFYSRITTQAAAFTLPDLIHYNAAGGAIGAGSTVTNQYGFNAGHGLTQATNNYGFYGGIASAANRWNFYAAGTAPNAYAGNSRFGALTVPTETIDATGNIAATGSVLSSGKANGVGYKTGAGGTITQATNRTTGVTLNAVCGSIVLAPAAGLATYQTFTVTNSAVAATDVVHISQKSGTDKYIIMVTRVAAGAFDVTFATTGGTTTEQPEFSFAIIRAVAA